MKVERERVNTAYEHLDAALQTVEALRNDLLREKAGADPNSLLPGRIDFLLTQIDGMIALLEGDVTDRLLLLRNSLKALGETRKGKFV